VDVGDGGQWTVRAAPWPPLDSPFTVSGNLLTNAGACPTVVANADHFVVAWNTDRGPSPGGEIDAVAVSADGGFPAGITVVSKEDYGQTGPAVAVDGHGTALLAYSRYDLAGGADRLHSRLIAATPMGTTGTGGGGGTSGSGGAGGGTAGGSPGGGSGGGHIAERSLHVACGCEQFPGWGVAPMLAMLRRRRRARTSSRDG
jgi:hypothetical protein